MKQTVHVGRCPYCSFHAVAAMRSVAEISLADHITHMRDESDHFQLDESYGRWQSLFSEAR